MGGREKKKRNLVKKEIIPPTGAIRKRKGQRDEGTRCFSFTEALAMVDWLRGGEKGKKREGTC